jgi:predicted transport protein
LAYRIKDSETLLSLKIALARQGEARCYPTDDQFRLALETRDIYHMTRTRNFLLDRLENDSEERIDTSGFTIEHVVPQNETLHSEWQAMLGPDWKKIQQTWLNRLGNVTLTAYNSEYSDRPFEEKKTLKDKEGKDLGFNSSPLRLNKFIREQPKWTEKEIERRRKEWAGRALKIWKPLVVDVEAVKKAELEDKKAQAAKYTIDSLELDDVSRVLLEKLRTQIQGLGQDVVDLFGSKSVTYRVYDFFVEVLPRKHRLLLLLNMDFAECRDPSGIAADATDNAWISNASESGGVIFSLRQESDILAALNLIRQAYESVAE